MKYKINEIFYSIQGEGARIGTANIFLRFSGCNLNCDFCDTTHHSYNEMTIYEILNIIKEYPCNWVILTGGEPTIYDLQPLISVLNRYNIAIETNGIISTKNLNLDWITVSPKTDYIHNDYKIKPPNEIKIVVTPYTKIKEWRFINCLYYVQPEGNKEENIKHCINLVKGNPRWRLSLQMHKILNIQ